MFQIFGYNNDEIVICLAIIDCETMIVIFLQFLKLVLSEKGFELRKTIFVD